MAVFRFTDSEMTIINYANNYLYLQEIKRNDSNVCLLETLVEESVMNIVHALNETNKSLILEDTNAPHGKVRQAGPFLLENLVRLVVQFLMLRQGTDMHIYLYRETILPLLLKKQTKSTTYSGSKMVCLEQT